MARWPGGAWNAGPYIHMRISPYINVWIYVCTYYIYIYIYIYILYMHDSLRAIRGKLITFRFNILIQSITHLLIDPMCFPLLNWKIFRSWSQLMLMLEWHASAVARSHAPLFLDCKWHGVKQSDSLVIDALNKCCEPTEDAMPTRLMTQTQKHWIGQSQLVAVTCHSKCKLSKWGKHPAQCHTIELSEWNHS